MNIPASDVINDESKPYSMGSDFKVEATLAAGIMQRYQMVIDYQNRTSVRIRRGGIGIDEG